LHTIHGWRHCMCDPTPHSCLKEVVLVPHSRPLCTDMECTRVTCVLPVFAVPQELSVHRDHSGGVVWTSFSPKGTYLGTAAMDSTAIVYVYLALLSGGCCVPSWVFLPTASFAKSFCTASSSCRHLRPTFTVHTPFLSVPTLQLHGFHLGDRVPFVGPRGWSPGHFLRP
jgi:hypothetical protein